MNHLLPLFESKEDYKKSVEVDVYYKFDTYLGYEINSIACGDIDVSFTIYIDQRTWGIKDVSLFAIKGPAEIPILVSYYDDDDIYEKELILPFNWDDVVTDEVRGTGCFTVDRLEMELEMDYSGVNFGSFLLGKKGKISIKKITAQTDTY